TTLHTFSANDGAQPYGTLVQSADGSFYGTANWGGPSGYGEIFKVDGAGTFAIVHAFGYSEGTYPYAGLTLGRDGYFYGTNQWGGAGYGTVYRADATGNLTVLHAFNYADGGRVWAGVTAGTDGFLYGTTYYGGPGGAGTVYKLDQTGASFATLHSFAGGDGGYPYGGVIQGPDGGLYGATSYGAPYYGTLFRVDATGAFTLLYPFDYYTGGAYPAATLYRDSDGRLYGTTQVGGSAGDGTAFRFALHLGAATGSSLVAASAVANFGGVAALTATLTSAGTPVGGRTVAFTINDAAVGSAVTNSSGVATLSNASLAGISAGTYPGAIRATFAGDVLIGAAVSAPSALVVEKGTPSIYWPAPNPIVEGTALDGTQLNASSDVAGSFVYTPAAGTVLGIGTGQMLSAVFTPADAVNYNLASADRFIDVLSASDVPDRFEVLHRFEYADGENSFSALVEGPDHSFYGTTNWGGPSGYGAVFKIDPLTRALTIVHAFDFSNEGAYPQAGLTLGADGYFYGTTSYGGPTYGGTVFKMDLAGALTVLHSFSSSTEGWYPTSPVVRDADGNLYGTTRYGGTGSAGTVFKLDPAGTLNVAHSFDWSQDGGYPNGVVLTSDGSLFGTTFYAGPSGSGTLFRIDPAGVFSVLRAFAYWTDGAYSNSGVLADSSGHVYGTTTNGGAFGYGTIFKADASGSFALLHALDYTHDGAYPSATLIQDGAGNLYGTTTGGTRMGYGTIFKLDPAGTLSTLHVFKQADGTDSEGALVFGSDGALYGTTVSGGAGGGGTVYRLTMTPSELALSPASGVYAGATTLSATLTSS